MRTLLAPTEEFAKRDRTRIGTDAAAGTSVVITLENNNGIGINDFVVIGYEGNELCEMVQVSEAPSGSTDIKVASMKFPHYAGEPVTRYRFDKRKFYGAVTEGGAYTELTSEGSPKQIQVDNPQGTFIEYVDNVYQYFKATYYNSVTYEETDPSDSDAVSGDESKRYASIYAIKKHAGLINNPFYSDARIETKRKQAENEIDSVLFSKYTLPLTEVPALISQICELLAAGYIDYEEFGGDGEGVKWLGTARAILKAIQEERQRLIGTDGQELATKTLSSGIQSYPDTAEGRKFTMNQIF